MCHDVHLTSEHIQALIARELLEAAEEDALEADGDDPSFLNDERETDVELLTDGGA